MVEDKLYTCPVSECHDRVGRMDKAIKGKVSWSTLLIIFTIVSGILGLFIDNKLNAIDNNSKAIIILEERSKDIKDVIKVSVKEAMTEFYK